MDFISQLWTPPKNNKVEALIGDEDFLRILCSYPELRDIVLHGDFYVCCPSSSSIIGSSMTKAAVMNHIMMPDVTPGDFKTINGKLCSIAGQYLILGDGFIQSRRIRILNTSVRTVDGGRTVTIYHINQPFTGGLRSPEDYDEISSVLVSKYMAAISTFPNMEVIINEMDDFVYDLHQLATLTQHQGFSQLQPSLRHCLFHKWKQFSALLHSRLSATAHGGSHHQGQLTLPQVEQIVESYLHKSIGPDILIWFKQQESQSIKEFISNIQQLRKITQKEMDIPPLFQAQQAEAIHLLVTMPQRTITPTDKLLFMKEVVMAIQETVEHHLQSLRDALAQEDSTNETNVDRELRLRQLEDVEFATDDLVPILILVLLQALLQKPDIYVELLFARQYHFVQATTSPIAFTTCHYDVALQWLSNPCNYPIYRPLSPHSFEEDQEFKEMYPSSPLASAPSSAKALSPVSLPEARDRRKVVIEDDDDEEGEVIAAATASAVNEAVEGGSDLLATS